MTLVKRTYTDFDSNTPIIAQNLNDIQDEIIANGTNIDTLQTDVGDIDTKVNAKANIASPTFTGTPTAPTATTGNSSTQIATTAFVNNEIANDVSTPMQTAGILNLTHANWDNSNTIILIADRFNGSIYKVYGTEGTAGTDYPNDMPVALRNTTTIIFRQQFAARSSSTAALIAVVVLWEVYPIPGRIWVNVYNDGWKGWKSVTLT